MTEPGLAAGGEIRRRKYDAVIVGSGPNGLAAAITIAQTGRSVLVIEGKDRPGGGARSAELTLPGFIHDVCAAMHPLGAASPFFSSLPLEQYGVRWVRSPAAVAHPLDDGTAVMLEPSIQVTASSLGVDGAAYRRWIGLYARDWRGLSRQMLGPFRLPAPRLLPLFGLFGLPSLLPASRLARMLFKGERARALFAGMAGHSMMPLERAGTGGFGLFLLLLGHGMGYPFIEGGTENLTRALLAHLRLSGGEVLTGRMVTGMEDLPAAERVLFDLTPRQIDRIAGDRFPDGYRRRLQGFRYGQGVFKVDYALDGPVPWKAAEVARAATVHLGGTLEEIEAGESAVWRGECPERPYVLVAQQTLFDPTRAPRGKHTVWAYCHAPRGFSGSMLEQIEAQFERFAPGFRDRILARHTTNAVEMERYNPNYVGGDINGGVQDLGQFFTRPVARIVPYATPAKGIFICSSSTPPGGGVHGMCGYYAAKAAL